MARYQLSKAVAERIALKLVEDSLKAKGHIRLEDVQDALSAEGFHTTKVTGEPFRQLIRFWADEEGKPAYTSLIVAVLEALAWKYERLQRGAANLAEALDDLGIVPFKEVE